VALVTLWLVSPAPPASAADEVPAAPTPRLWPAAVALAPTLGTTAHSLRISGPDRYQTNLAMALTLRGQGDAPFDTPDRTSGGAVTLAEADGWWGSRTCPLSVIVVAGDSAADALAAASLSDPTDGSDEPRLLRVASATSLLDIGVVDQVDTELAPILVTTSARQGATGLAPATETAAVDLSRGGCQSAGSAIVVGGTAAVPPGVEPDLVEAGYDEVFRVAGADRYDTARRIAEALGTGTPTAGATCGDEGAPGGSATGSAALAFHANAVVELRDSRTECRLLSRTVVLADGITGADALAAGWWTSFFQVPVLLAGPDGTLPAPTREALQSLDIDNLVVLGGTARFPEVTLEQAGALATAEPLRVAGTDRFATSVAMAQRFGGWFPTGAGDDFAGAMVCLAGSAGEGPSATGWPDALAAGPWCAAAAQAGAGPPRRALPPVTGPASVPADAPAPPAGPGRAMPVLLTPPAEAALAGSVTDLLEEAFAVEADWCSGTMATEDCLAPGFAAVFGGSAAVSDLAVRRAADLVSGQRYVTAGDTSPAATEGFWTRLDLRPVFHLPADPDAERACYDRDALDDVRWLAATTGAGVSTLAGFDLLAVGAYQLDADGVARSPGQNAPICAAWADEAPAPEPPAVEVAGVSLSGHASAPLMLDTSSAARLELSGAVGQFGPEERTGAPGASVEPGVVTRWLFEDDVVPGGPAVVSRGAGTDVGGASINLAVTRGPNADPLVPVDTFSATLELRTPIGTVVGEASGEARFVEGRWELRGRTEFSGGTWNVAAGAGGFSATVDLNVTDDDGDDEVTWEVDGLVTGPG